MNPLVSFLGWNKPVQTEETVGDRDSWYSCYFSQIPHSPSTLSLYVLWRIDRVSILIITPWLATCVWLLWSLSVLSALATLHFPRVIELSVHCCIISFQNPFWKSPKLFKIVVLGRRRNGYMWPYFEVILGLHEILKLAPISVLI